MNIDRFLPYGRQVISKADKEAVLEVLEKDFITQGSTIEDFEDAFICFFL